MAHGTRCPHVERCELFPLLQLGGTLGYCLNTYCFGDFQGCARFRFVREHGRRPSPSLLPNGGEDPSVDPTGDPT
ncbi:MAG: hypothetical protein KDK70_21005, partial [Myxococcales bacterium]|nr:hypothetical protein [Myxococcales bacterium]